MANQEDKKPNGTGQSTGQDHIESDARAIIEETYKDPIKTLSDSITDLEESKRVAKEQDETAQRRSRSMKMIAGISDGLTSLANLIGVGQGGTNIDTGTGSLTPLTQRMEQARKEREADIKSISDRLDQERSQLLQMRQAKGTALAEISEAEASRRFNKALQEDEQAFTTSEREAGEEHSDQQLDKKLNADLVKTSATIKSDADQKELDRQNRLETARIRAASSSKTSGKQPEQFILKDADGNSKVYSIPDNTAAAILKNFDDAIKADLAADTSTDAEPSTFREAYNHYVTTSRNKGLGLATDQQVKDARNALISASPTLRADIEKYGTLKDGKWSEYEVTQ